MEKLKKWEIPWLFVFLNSFIFLVIDFIIFCLYLSRATISEGEELLGFLIPAFAPFIILPFTILGFGLHQYYKTTKVGAYIWRLIKYAIVIIVINYIWVNLLSYYIITLYF